MRFTIWALIATAVGITASYTSLHHGYIALAPLIGFEGLVIWYAHRYHPEDWNRD